MALSVLTTASQVYIDLQLFLVPSIDVISTVDSVASELGWIHGRPHHPHWTNLRAHSGKQVVIADQCDEEGASGDRAGYTGMCTVRHEICGNHKFL